MWLQKILNAYDKDGIFKIRSLWNHYLSSNWSWNIWKSMPTFWSSRYVFEKVKRLKILITFRGEKENVTRAFAPKLTSTAILSPRPLSRKGKISDIMSQPIGPKEICKSKKRITISMIICKHHHSIFLYRCDTPRKTKQEKGKKKVKNEVTTLITIKHA